MSQGEFRVKENRPWPKPGEASNMWDGLPEPAPCPWCGTAEALVTIKVGRERYVACHVCNARGPLSQKSNVDAVQKWNGAVMRCNTQ